MKKIFLNLIIWLFEKYAQNEWENRAYKAERQRIKIEHNLQEDEIDEFLIEKDRKPQKEAYEVGKAEGWEKAMEARAEDRNIY